MMNETLQSRSRSTLYAIAQGVRRPRLRHFRLRKETKEAVVQELSDVASRSLGEQNMQAQAAMVTIQTLQALLEHGETVQRSVTFLSAVAEHEQTREALIKLLVSALKDKAVVNEALELVLWVLDDKNAREHLVSALIAALNNERFLQAASEFAAQWLSKEEVRESVAQVFKEASLDVLADDHVRAYAEQFVQGLLQEPGLQAKTSEHLWSALRGLVIAPRKPPIVVKPRSARGSSSSSSSTSATVLPEEPATVQGAMAVAAAEARQQQQKQEHQPGAPAAVSESELQAAVAKAEEATVAAPSSSEPEPPQERQSESPVAAVGCHKLSTSVRKSPQRWRSPPINHLNARARPRALRRLPGRVRCQDLTRRAWLPRH